MIARHKKERGQVLLYTVDVDDLRLEGATLWLIQNQMVALFSRDKQVI